MADHDYLDDLAGTSSALISDALDALHVTGRVLDPAVRPVTAGSLLVGRAVPVVVGATNVILPEPYASEMQAIDTLRPGEVPLYVVPPGVDAAIWGELFSCAAIGRGVVGAVVDGPIRDIRQIRELGFPVFFRGRSPYDTRGRAVVQEFRVSAVCAGVEVDPGDYVVADDDGIVVVPQQVAPDVAEIVTAKAGLERQARDDLMSGVSLPDVWNRYQVL